MRAISGWPLGAPAMFLYTLVKLSPASWLTCKLPSSVPTQMTPGLEGDSRTCVESELAEYPSCFSAMGLSPATPMMGSSGSQRLTFCVRSVGFMVQVSPRLLLLKKYCDAM